MDKLYRNLRRIKHIPGYHKRLCGRYLIRLLSPYLKDKIGLSEDANILHKNSRKIIISSRKALGLVCEVCPVINIPYNILAPLINEDSIRQKTYQIGAGVANGLSYALLLSPVILDPDIAIPLTSLSVPAKSLGPLLISLKHKSGIEQRIREK